MKIRMSFSSISTGLFMTGVLLFSTFSTLIAQDSYTNVEEALSGTPSQHIADIDKPSQIFEQAIEFYQSIISPIKQENCPMYPSCSQYGLECLKKHGFVGILKLIDRLNRCGHDLEKYKPVITGFEIYYLDLP